MPSPAVKASVQASIPVSTTPASATISASSTPVDVLFSSPPMTPPAIEYMERMLVGPSVPMPTIPQLHQHIQELQN
jgi:hypothetical protein